MSPKTKSLIVIIVTLIVSALSVAAAVFSVIKYFNSKESEIFKVDYASLNILMESEKDLNTTQVTKKVVGAEPGDFIDFSNVSIVNTTSSPVYTIVHVEVEIERERMGTLYYDSWHNVDGDVVDIVDFEQNFTPASVLNGQQSYVFNLKNLKILGEDKFYKETTFDVSTKINVHSVKKDAVVDAENYAVEENVYASYYLVKQESLRQQSEEPFNIFNIPYSASQQYKSGTTKVDNGVTFKLNDDNSISAKGKVLNSETYKNRAVFQFYEGVEMCSTFKVNKTYILKLKKVGGTSSRIALLFCYEDESGWHWGERPTTNAAIDGVDFEMCNISAVSIYIEFYYEWTETVPADITVVPYLYEKPLEITTEPPLKV